MGKSRRSLPLRPPGRHDCVRHFFSHRHLPFLACPTRHSWAQGALLTSGPTMSHPVLYAASDIAHQVSYWYLRSVLLINSLARSPFRLFPAPEKGVPVPLVSGRIRHFRYATHEKGTCGTTERASIA